MYEYMYITRYPGCPGRAPELIFCEHIRAFERELLLPACFANRF